MSEQLIPRGAFCPTCGRYNVRAVAVDGLLVKDKTILLILRNSGQEIDKWALIGGGVDWDETAEEAIVREAREEVGIITEVKQLLSVSSNPKRDPNNAQTIAIAYILTMRAEDMHVNPKEVQEARWFALDDLPESIAFDHRSIIESYKHSFVKEK